MSLQLIFPSHYERCLRQSETYNKKPFSREFFPPMTQLFDVILEFARKAGSQPKLVESKSKRAISHFSWWLPLLKIHFAQFQNFWGRLRCTDRSFIVLRTKNRWFVKSSHRWARNRKRTWSIFATKMNTISVMARVRRPDGGNTFSAAKFVQTSRRKRLFEARWTLWPSSRTSQ